ncbi:hypothetical protein CDAR_296261 [Caerostris darwini]|uniref:Uncharacterized protein n=1 Tax=Caerostris darwini TaxID=1538125 RepID=A0AAV4URX9_9ARAC|nr:hypothetical protein CDAR_296261 [Caerostris darwini]
MGLPPNGKDIECWCGCQSWIGISHCYLEKGVSPRNFSDHKAQHFRSCAERFCLFAPILQLIGRQLLLKVVFLCSLERIGKKRIGSEA